MSHHSKGFTLLELLVALAVCTAILFPVSQYLFSGRAQRLAEERFVSRLILEMHLHRAFLAGEAKSISLNVQNPIRGELEIEIEKQGDEICYDGKFFRPGKKTKLSQLILCRFEKQ